MKKIFPSVAFGLILFSGANAQAANLAVITNPPTFLSLFVFGGAVACLVFSVQILQLLRGGYLFKSWQIFVTGFIVLALSQVGSVLSDFEVFTLPKFAVPSLLVVSVGLFFYGIYELKRTLN